MRRLLLALLCSSLLLGCGRHRHDGDVEDAKRVETKKKKQKKHKKRHADDADDAAPAATAAVTTDSSRSTSEAQHFTFNGRAATPSDLETLKKIEAMYGRPTPSGDYWYDATSGAAGAWGGPTLGFLPAKLDLGAPLPANASGGGDGRLTGIFINGRELHPIDVKVLLNIYGQVIPGRFWVDGNGNAGREGGPALVNLVQLAQQRAAAGRGSGAASYYRSDGRGNNAFVGGGCVSVSSTTGSGYDKKSYDYYSSGC